MKKVVQIAHDILLHADVKGAAADFTLGQGYDCECLMGMAPIHTVYAFEIQETAMQEAKAYLQGRLGHEKVRFLQHGHEEAARWIDEPLSAGIFNFGYYPKGDPSITTRVETSAPAFAASWFWSSIRAIHRDGGSVLILIRRSLLCLRATMTAPVCA